MVGPLRVDSVVLDHLRCLRCGYDLFHQGYGGRCPECGLAVAQSEPTIGLAQGDARWLGRLARASAWLEIALKLQPWTLVAVPVAWALVGPLVPSPAALFYGTLVVMCASVGAVWVGVVLFTAPDAPRLFALRLAPCRLRARSCACILAGLWLAAWVALALCRHDAAILWAKCLLAAYAAFAVIGFDSLMAYAVRIVALARARWVQEEVQRLRRQTLAVTCLFALAFAGAAIWSSSGPFRIEGFVVFVLLGAIAGLGLSFWWARLGDLFRQVAHVIARAQRAALRTGGL